MQLNEDFGIRERDENGQLVLNYLWWSFASFNGSCWRHFNEDYEVFEDLTDPSYDEVMTRTNGRIPTLEEAKAMFKAVKNS